MQVLFVRHAESLNNHLKDLQIQPGKARLRYPDPALSEKGSLQLKYMGEGITRMIRLRRPPIRGIPSHTQPLRIFLAVSPMRRTLLTAIPIMEALEHFPHLPTSLTTTIVPFIFEKGGCYSDTDAGTVKAYPGLDATEANQIIPSALIENPETMQGGWWKSDTRETPEAFQSRATKTVSWIEKHACENLCDVLILVTHEGFACACLRQFLLSQPPLLDWLYNGSFSSLTLTPSENPPVDIADGDTQDHKHVHVVVDYLNSVAHLPLDTIT